LWFGFVTAVWAQPAELLKKPEKPKRDPAAPVHLSADRLQYDRDTQVVVAEGHVVVEQGPTKIEAERATFNRETGEAVFTGNVRAREGEDTLETERLELDLDTRLGEALRGKLFLKKDHFHIEGERLERVAEDRYLVHRGSFTSCDAAIPDWRFRAKEFDLHQGEEAVGKDVVFYIRDVPVFYTPYFRYPVRKERKTGFLMPRIGSSNTDGFRYTQPFFWAIAENMDATIKVDYWSKRGVGVGGEFRYILDKDSRGEMNAFYLHDRLTGNSRWEFHAKHDERLPYGITAKADVNLYTERYLQDLTDETFLRVQRTADSNIIFSKPLALGTVTVLAQYTDNLFGPNQTIVQRLPEVRYIVTPQRIARTPLLWSLNATAVNFYREEGITGQRLDINPQLTATFPLGYGFQLTPRLGLRETVYSRSRETNDPISREIFDLGVVLSTKISRVYDIQGYGTVDKVRHQIEPSLTYDLIPQVDQSKLPQFDGVDLMTRRNQLTFAVTHRLTARYREGEEIRRFDFLTFRISEAYNLVDSAASLFGPIFPANRPFSDLRAELVVRTPKQLSFNADVNYNLYDLYWSSVNSDLRYTATDRSWFVAVGERFTRDLLTFYTAEAGTSRWRPWSLSGKVFYDARNDQLTELNLKAVYQAQCWTATFLFIERPDATKFFVTVSLKGLGGIK
jgi:LPS-assembly protein